MRRTTERGFAVYDTVPKDARGQRVRVQESSEIGGPYCWVFVDGGAFFPPHADRCVPDYWHYPQAYLTVEQAKAVRDALTAFIDDAET